MVHLLWEGFPSERAIATCLLAIKKVIDQEKGNKKK